MLVSATINSPTNDQSVIWFNLVAFTESYFFYFFLDKKMTHYVCHLIKKILDLIEKYFVFDRCIVVWCDSQFYRHLLLVFLSKQCTSRIYNNLWLNRQLKLLCQQLINIEREKQVARNWIKHKWFLFGCSFSSSLRL